MAYGFLILLGVGALFVAWLVSAYNGLVTKKALVDEGWSGIDVQLKRRYDLIPNLVETVKGYAGHEKSVFENVTRLRSSAMNATTLQEKVEAENQLTGALKTLFAVAENYPELKANQNFLSLQQSLSAIEDEIQLSRRYYNGAARNYNVAVTVLPTNIIAQITGFSKVPYFEATEAERQAQRVKFD